MDLEEKAELYLSSGARQIIMSHTFISLGDFVVCVTGPS